MLGFEKGLRATMRASRACCQILMGLPHGSIVVVRITSVFSISLAEETERVIAVAPQSPFAEETSTTFGLDAPSWISLLISLGNGQFGLLDNCSGNRGPLS
jgi:hypothetical protein